MVNAVRETAAARLKQAADTGAQNHKQIGQRPPCTRGADLSGDGSEDCAELRAPRHIKKATMSRLAMSCLSENLMRATGGWGIGSVKGVPEALTHSHTSKGNRGTFICVHGSAPAKHTSASGYASHVGNATIGGHARSFLTAFKVRFLMLDS